MNTETETIEDELAKHAAECREKLQTEEVPDALLKALMDPFSYALGLKDGSVIHFHEAHIAGPGWIRLISDDDKFSFHRCRCERGLEIRLSDIRWIADAPHGS